MFSPQEGATEPAIGREENGTDIVESASQENGADIVERASQEQPNHSNASGWHKRNKSGELLNT